MDEPSVSQQEVTKLLARWSQGDDAALSELTPLVYDELRRIAHRHMGGQRPDHTLQTTALVNEVYLRIASESNVTWEGRQHFFFAASRAMRDILVEQARRKAGPKRGGGLRRRELDEMCAVEEAPSDEVLAVHEALKELEAQDPLKAQIVLLRYFTGLTMDETAAVLGLAERTLARQRDLFSHGAIARKDVDAAGNVSPISAPRSASTHRSNTTMSSIGCVAACAAMSTSALAV